MSNFKLELTINGNVTAMECLFDSQDMANIKVETGISCPTCHCRTASNAYELIEEKTSEPLFIQNTTLGGVVFETLFAYAIKKEGQGGCLSELDGFYGSFLVDVKFVEMLSETRNKSVGIDGVELHLVHDAKSGTWTCTIDLFSRSSLDVFEALGDAFNDFVSTEIAFFEE